ncbi:contactin-1a isoform X5 [Drosophila tropicalis]|uniref:contactin-1a isoform X5 n=1 Tax=Drosophila tropicalis TaxID=46794 RepID=UPI0035AB8C69
MSSTPCSVLTLSSFNLLFFTQVLTVLSSAIKYNEYATDKGGNVSIPCIAEGNIMWIKEHGSNNTIIQTGRILVLHNVSTTDSGIYVCFAALPRRITSTTTTTTTTTTAIPATSTTTSSQDLSKIESETIDEIASKPEKNEKKKQDQEQEHQEEQDEMEYQACQRTLLKVRTTPGPVTQLYFKASTILGFLIWRFNKTQSGGYPVRSFTAEYRNVSYDQMPVNETYEHAWSRMDPINIAPNVRQMEVYRLAPNTTYEFRIWANNELGSGVVVTTNVTTLPETKEEVNPMELKVHQLHLCLSNITIVRLIMTTMRLTTTTGTTTTMMMMMITMKNDMNPLWRNSNGKFQFFLQVPPLNAFESTKSNGIFMNIYHICILESG